MAIPSSLVLFKSGGCFSDMAHAYLEAGDVHLAVLLFVHHLMICQGAQLMRWRSAPPLPGQDGPD